MNRLLLEQMLRKMKKLLQEGKPIGDLKIGALYALGSQLEAIFYFIGHELGSTLQDDFENNKINQNLKRIAQKYNLGTFISIEEESDHIAFELDNCGTCKDIDASEIEMSQGFCSFEAGLFAGVVEKITGKHCFAQELECRLQGENDNCKFMIVIPED
jgi:predicted hydrocarbon binding protein